MCSPEGRACIELHSGHNLDCSVNCEGIYASVLVSQEDMVERKLGRNGGQDFGASHKFSRLVKEYNSHKKRRLPNFRFNSAKASSLFGEFLPNIFPLLMLFL